MPRIDANRMQLEYEAHGDPSGTPVLLIMGLGSQLTRWPEPFYRALVDAGCHVIRYDNRDVGLSTRLDHLAPTKLLPAIVRARLGLPIRAPYLLSDLADDAVGLLDALGLPTAHVVGVSMGGMIAQLLAAHHGHRVRSLTSIMSSSGHRGLPQPHWRVQLALAKPPRRDREARLAWTVEFLRMIGSPQFPTDAATLRANAIRDMERGDYPRGFIRHLVAILASGSRAPILGQIKAPTLILHGAEDPLVPAGAASDLHRRIPGSELEIYPGMGHDLPAALTARLTGRIVDHLRRADARDPAATTAPPLRH